MSPAPHRHPCGQGGGIHGSDKALGAAGSGHRQSLEKFPHVQANLLTNGDVFGYLFILFHPTCVKQAC